MASRGPYRRHSPHFKIQICSDIRSGKIGRREALKTHNLSTNLMQMWLGQFDRGELDAEDAAASTVAEYEAHIAALERKVGQLTMELGLLRKTPRLRLVNNNENSSIICGAKPAPSDGDAK
jgi:transposase-like protein